MCSKYLRTLELAVHVIRLDLKYGYLKWKVTDLSRTVAIARSQIYEKLGKNKNEILMASLSLILDELYGFSPEHRQYSKTNGEFQGLLRSRQTVISSPELLSFYFLHRNSENDIGSLIREKENRFLKLVGEKNNVKNEKMILFIRTIIHGVSVAPFLNDKQVADCMKILSDLIEQNLRSQKTE